MKLNFNNRKGFTLIELIICLIFVAIIGSLLFGGIRGCSTYSEGSRVGTVSKFSLKGAAFKTWEGELLLGGLKSGLDGKMTANVWAFTVDKERSDLIDAIQNAMDRNQVVRIKYDERALPSPFSGDTRYRVKEVMVVPPTN